MRIAQEHIAIPLCAVPSPAYDASRQVILLRIVPINLGVDPVLIMVIYLLNA
jgi:hypothetical protein